MVYIVDLVETSLQVEYASIERLGPGIFRATRPESRSASTPQSVLVGVSDREEGLEPGEAERLAQTLTTLKARHKPEQSFLVLASGKGMPAPVATRLAEDGITRQGLIEFLDRFYRVREKSRQGAYDKVRAFARVNKHLIADRVAHRYQRIGADGLPIANATTGDLFAHLLSGFESPGTGPRLALVTGQAGGGKTILFKALFSALYDRFQEVKAKRYAGLFPRPVFFIPDYLKEAQSYSFDSLLDAMFETVGAASISPEYLRWLHANRSVLLMFDGMEEFFARQTDLFDHLTETMTMPGSRAQVLICARDSLLATSAELRRFIERLESTSGPKAIDIYKLLPWGEDERLRLAHLRVTGRPLAAGGALDPAATAIGARIAGTPALAELCRTPFFCDLVVELHRGQVTSLPDDMLDILDLVLDRFLSREVDKLRHLESTDDPKAAYLLGEVDEAISADPLALLLTSREREMLDKVRGELGQSLAGRPELLPRLLELHAQVSRSGVLDLLAAAAHLHRRRRAPTEAGLAEDDLAGLLAAHGIGHAPDSELGFRAMLIFKQLALFSQRPGTRAIDFTHEYLADHLAARHALAVLAADPAAVEDAVGDLSLERTEVFDLAIARGLERDADLADRVRSALADGACDAEIREYVAGLLDRSAVHHAAPS